MDIKNLPFGFPPDWKELSEEQQKLVRNEQFDRLGWKSRVHKKTVVFRPLSELDLKL